MKNQLLILMLFISTISVYAETTYVSTISSLKSTLNSASAGDIIYLRDGTYSNLQITINKSGTANNPIKILAENPGEVKFIGECNIKISGNFIQIGGFSFKETRLPTGNLFDVTGNNNVVEDMYMYFLKSLSGAHRYVYLPKGAKNNVIRRCWFEKGTTQGISVFQFSNNTGFETKTIVEDCYFKGKRQVTTNGGETVRFGTQSSGADYKGGNIVRNNLFDESDGEPEIISLKCSDNIIEGNTFTNSHGHVACRHMGRNIIRNNYFITSKSKPYTDAIAVWGRGHKIENNYFFRSKSKERNDGGAITLHSGNGDKYSSSFENVRDVLVKDNIIVEPNEHAFALGARKKNTMPKNITFEGNLVYSNTDKAMIWYWKPTTGIVYKENKIFKKVGLSPIPSGISNTNPNLTQDQYGVWRAPGKGPSGRPLKKNDVGPIWLRTNNNSGANIEVTGVSLLPTSANINIGESVSLNESISPSNSTDKSVVWSSNNTAVADVDNNGNVTAKTEGVAIISVETNDGGKKATSTITVSSSPTIVTLPTNETIVHIKKRNAPNYALSVSSDRNVNLQRSNLSNENQQWVEISRGDNFYSYRKRNTNYCLAGGKGGARNQNVRLYTCNRTNRNQHWRKINLGSNYFRLQKRNAFRFSIEGGIGGSVNQNVKLWNSSNSNQNQQWEFTIISGNTLTVDNKSNLLANVGAQKTVAYPNPFISNITILLRESHDLTKLYLYDINGKQYLSKSINSGDEEVILENLQLDKGLYFVKLLGKGSFEKTLRLVKN